MGDICRCMTSGLRRILRRRCGTARFLSHNKQDGQAPKKGRYHMPNTTKQALEESLKHMLLKKPLDKITIRDITEDCGISRMAFYYHFQDIYDLVEWSCIEDATKALQGKKTYESEAKRS